MWASSFDNIANNISDNRTGNISDSRTGNNHFT